MLFLDYCAVITQYTVRTLSFDFGSTVVRSSVLTAHRPISKTETALGSSRGNQEQAYTEARSSVSNLLQIQTSYLYREWSTEFSSRINVDCLMYLHLLQYKSHSADEGRPVLSFLASRTSYYYIPDSTED